MSKFYDHFNPHNKIIRYETEVENPDYFDNYFYYIFSITERKLYNKITLEIVYEEIITLFELFWEHEFRSSNFSTKIFYFFSVWHTSAMTTSFYDFLYKTKLLQDEAYFRALYDKYLRKKYRKAIAREKPKIDALWAQVLR